MCCPGCKKEHLITLSVCPSCGTMIGDSVREELAEKLVITTAPKVVTKRRTATTVQKPSNQIKLNPPPSPIITEKALKSATAEINAKMTNRTLVEFQSRDGTVPEWRTQLKNAVQQRMMQKTADSNSTGTATATALAPEQPQSDGEFFDGAEIIEEKLVEVPGNELLSSALKRIKSSREKYHIEDTSLVTVAPRVEQRERPRHTAVPKAKPKPETSEKSSLNFPAKPAYTPNVDLYDTSELNPDFAPAKVSSSFGKVTVRKTAAVDSLEEEELIPEKKIAAEPKPTAKPEVELEVEAATAYEDDRAGFAFRFNAGLFDLLTASFASMILLAPFTLLGGNWFSIAGLFAFLATCSIVNFIYLTTTIGMFGKSFGMHLFDLEMIDAEGDEYPTLHQAAVSSSVFLLSLAVGGAGFLTCLFDEEGRAIHDIVSNTLVVKEI